MTHEETTMDWDAVKPALYEAAKGHWFELDSLFNERDELLSEVAGLRDWKESAMNLLHDYDAIAEPFGGKLGSSKIQNLERGVAQLREALVNLTRACTPSGLPGEPQRGVRMPEKEIVAAARAALAGKER